MGINRRGGASSSQPTIQVASKTSVANTTAMTTVVGDYMNRSNNVSGMKINWKVSFSPSFSLSVAILSCRCGS